MPLKYLSNLWRTYEMFLINCEINLILTWSAHCVIPGGNRATTFSITDTKIYVPFVAVKFVMMQNYCNNWNQDSDAQLIGININQQYQQKYKMNI